MEIFELLRDIGIFGLAMFFIQLIISKSADRKFESYKSELDSKTREFQTTLDSKLELYKAELSLQNYKSTQAYEKQLESIIILNEKLSHLNREMIAMTSFLKTVEKDFDKEEKERISKAAKLYDEFIVYYDAHKLFYPEFTAQKIEKIRNDFFTSFIDYTFSFEIGYKDKQTMRLAREASGRIQKEIPPAIESLISDFRDLIGIN